MVKLLTIKQVAEVLLLSETKVRQLISSGKLAYHQIDGSIRISDEDLQSYLSSCRGTKEQRAVRAGPAPKLKHLRLS